SQNDWVRGPCTYGIMPCNGLLYAPPNPCFCYPGVKLTGFNALAPAAKAESGKRKAEQGPRLQRGAAYGKPATGGATTAGLGDWPTYRHDARRSGATAGKVSPEVSQRWKVTLGGPLTPPVVAGDRVFVAAKNEHTLHALAIDDGRKLWQCTVGGRIDSPPTIYGALVLFGSADGHVYCLRAADGERVWRFRAAPSDRQIVAFGQLESPWRVHGSILLDNGLAYCTAGRSTYLDGGIRVFALDPATGKVVHETCLDTWARTREDAVGKPFIAGYHIEGALSDVLVSEGDSIFLGQYELDRTLAQREVPYVDPKGKDAPVAMDLSKQPFVVENVERNQGFEVHQRKWVDKTQAALVEQYNRTHGHYSFGDRRMGRHVLATGGFLDDSWYNRTFWMYSESWPGFYLGHLGAKTGHLLVVGPKKTYALQAYPERNLQSPLFTPGGKGYLLFADANDNEPVLDHRTRGTTKGWGFTRMKAPVWHHWIPVRVRGMVLAGESLFIAGPPDVLDPDDPMASFEGRKGALLRACSADGGKILSEQKLEAPPVFDGLIAASGRLLMSATDGSVVCFGPE
ncbi:MAG: PQQ-like beta-propeller repeat protein, partial [Planctomycetes bacterium]|nr:PQQ-like beta-propeller repeat protein [Planctomycetota bacterium]